MNIYKTRIICVAPQHAELYSVGFGDTLYLYSIHTYYMYACTYVINNICLYIIYILIYILYSIHSIAMVHGARLRRSAARCRRRLRGTVVAMALDVVTSTTAIIAAFLGLRGGSRKGGSGKHG